jgi:hypothetical protein
MIRVFTIEPDEAVKWVGVNDVVMGGVSSGAVMREPDGAIVFAGNVSFERSGGFASARRPFAGEAFPDVDAFRLRLAGDGKRYKLAAYTDSGQSGFAYQCGFPTRRGESALLLLPLASFEARLRGRPLAEAPPCDARMIRAIGFVIADRQEGPFRLRVEAIEGMSSAR